MGEAIALGLAAEGATVVVAGRRQAKLDEVYEGAAQELAKRLGLK